DEVVATLEIRVARVVVDDELVDLLQTVDVALLELLELHAEAPVRIARRKPSVRGDHVDLLGVEELEDHLEEVEPEVDGVLADLLRPFGELGTEIGREPGSHRPFPRKVLIERTMSSRLLISERRSVSEPAKFSR